MGNGIVHTISNNGAIWSSARTLKRSLKWGNERNPRSALQVSQKTAPPFWQYSILLIIYKYALCLFN